jgi:NifU-like protein involved in Fe-S cluster formation
MQASTALRIRILYGKQIKEILKLEANFFPALHIQAVIHGSSLNTTLDQSQFLKLPQMLRDSGLSQA